MQADPQAAAAVGGWLAPAAAIIAALIGGAFALLAARVSCRKQVREAVEEEKRRYEVQAESLASQQAKMMIEQYGFRARRSTSRLVISADGGATLIRSWHGVRVEAGFQIPHIPGKLEISTPGGEIKKVESSHQFAEESAKAVVFKKSIETKTQVVYRIEIAPALAAEDPELRFEVGAEFSNAVLMTQPEVDKAYAGGPFPHDYYALDVEYPTDEIELSVQFPKDAGFKLYPVVFYGGSELRHQRETTAVGGTSSFARSGEDEARLKVVRPKVAFRYAIAWIAPDSAPTSRAAA